mgnify:CR=1 FL=1
MNNTLGEFQKRKAANSAFITLKDGESCKILRVRTMKPITKESFGKEGEFLRLECDVETSEGIKLKQFDNGATFFINQLVEKGVDVGSSFTLKREGELTKTKYFVSDVVNTPKPTGSTTTAAPAGAAPAPTTATPPAPSTSSTPNGTL